MSLWLLLRHFACHCRSEVLICHFLWLDKCLFIKPGFHLYQTSAADNPPPALALQAILSIAFESVLLCCFDRTISQCANEDWHSLTTSADHRDLPSYWYFDPYFNPFSPQKVISPVHRASSTGQWMFNIKLARAGSSTTDVLKFMEKPESKQLFPT